MKKLARAQAVYIVMLFLCVAAFFALVEMAMADEFGVAFWAGAVALPAVGVALAFYCCDRFRCPHCRRIVGTVFRRWGVAFCPSCGGRLAKGPPAQAAPAGSPAAPPAEGDTLPQEAPQPVRGAGYDLLRIFAVPLLLLLGIVVLLHSLDALGPYGLFIRGAAAGVAAFWGAMIFCTMAFSRRLKCTACGRGVSDLQGDTRRIAHCPYCGAHVPAGQHPQPPRGGEVL